MQPLDLALLSTATWYVAFVVTKPTLAGPFGVLAWFRAHVPLGGLTHCVICFAPWCGALLYVLWHTPLQPIVVILAVAGMALMASSWTGASHL